MALYLLIAGLFVLLSSPINTTGERTFHPVDIQAIKSGEGYNVQLKTQGKSHLVTLQRPQGHVLDENVHIIHVDVDDATGKFKYSKWIPSDHEIKQANDIFVDHNQKAVLKVSAGTSEQTTVVSGVFSEMSIVHNGSTHLAVPSFNTHSDYIDLKRNLSEASISILSSSVNPLMEILIVCDKEFGDIFGHDNQRILDYWTVYMWDLNLRYKTLPSNDISFRINSIVVISSYAAQPFIEETRTADDRAELGQIFDKYAKWLYSQSGSLPKHDLAPLVTNTALGWYGGLSMLNGACWVDHTHQREFGAPVFFDAGHWGSVTIAAHQIAHNLGAPNDDDPNYPGGCDQQGFIMGSDYDERRYAFSECTDRTIKSFMSSGASACLQNIDESRPAMINAPFIYPKAPTMEETCKRAFKSDSAYIQHEDTFNCKRMICKNPIGNGETEILNIPPVENMICGGGSGRCFRGVCRPGGYTFKNVGSGLCMTASDQFAYTAPANMIQCPADGTPLERFVVTSSPNGNNLATPFLHSRNEESGDKCLYTGNADGGRILTDRCNPENPWHGWDFWSAGNEEFLLVHRITGRCAKPESNQLGSVVRTWNECNHFDRDMLWTRFL